MKDFFRTLFSGRLWINLLLIAVTLIIVVQLVLWWLGAYTQHGESITVPNLVGYNIGDVKTILDNTNLHYEITDSVYSDEMARGVVVTQNPVPQKSVKKGRTIFVTMNSSLPEMVRMPDLMGKSRRIALPLIEIAGLQIENLEYKPDDSCTDCVVGSTFQGKAIKAGDKLRKGEKITLILGRASNIRTVVPAIIGLTYKAASEIIYTQSLNMGQIIECKGCLTADDSSNAYVVRQIPYRGGETTLGAFVDVFLTTDSTAADTYQAPTDTIDYEMD